MYKKMILVLAITSSLFANETQIQNNSENRVVQEQTNQAETQNVQEEKKELSLEEKKALIQEQENKLKALKKEVNKQELIDKNAFGIRSGEAFRAFYLKYVPQKNINKAIIELKGDEQTYSLDENTVSINIPSIINCSKKEVKNGVINIYNSVKFVACKFSDDLIINNFSNEETKIVKSIGNLTLKGKNFLIEEGTLDLLTFKGNVVNTTINKSAIKFIKEELTARYDYNIHTNFTIQSSNIKNYISLYNDKENYIYWLNSKIINSNFTIDDKISISHNKTLLVNSEIKGKLLGGGARESLDIINSHLDLDKFTYTEGCILHNNIKTNEFNFNRDKTSIINNIIDTRNLKDNNKKNIVNTNDPTLSLVKSQGLALSAESVPSHYSAIGLSLNSIETKCATFTENKDLILQNIQNDKNAKPRSLEHPTPGQYEATINNVLEKEFDFSFN